MNFDSVKPPKAQEIPGWDALNAQVPRTDKTLVKHSLVKVFERSLLERDDPLRSSTEGATKSHEMVTCESLR